MTENIDLTSIICNALTQDQSLDESAADLGQLIQEMRREKEVYGRYTQRWAELKRLADIQERVVLMRLRDTPEDPPPKWRHLSVVK